MKRTVLVTGASSGIGKDIAILLAQHGYKVYGAARRADRLEELKTYAIVPAVLDVTDDTSMTSCIQHILQEEGRIDILINNAGFGSYGAVEDVAMAAARYQLEVNVIGAMRLAQQVLPGMRANNYGKIINISSVGGKVALPMGAWYHASKFALEGLSDCMRYELKEFGVDVVVIEPGATASEWLDIAFESLMKVSGNTAYRHFATKTRNAFSKAAKGKSEAITIAQLVKKAIEAKQPKARYAGGGMSMKIILFLKRVLSDRMMDHLIMNQLK